MFTALSRKQVEYVSTYHYQRPLVRVRASQILYHRSLSSIVLLLLPVSLQCLPSGATIIRPRYLRLFQVVDLRYPLRFVPSMGSLDDIPEIPTAATTGISQAVIVQQSRRRALLSFHAPHTVSKSVLNTVITLVPNDHAGIQEIVATLFDVTISLCGGAVPFDSWSSSTVLHTLRS